MLLIHPTIQFAAIIVAIYVFYLGIQRFRMVHLKHNTRFQWKRHVTLGMIIMCTWMIGMAGGITMVRIHWYRFFMTGIHGKVALVMLPFILFGLSSGLYMNYVKKKRGLFPLVHGFNNLLVLLLALSQIVTGLKVYYDFVLSY